MTEEIRYKISFDQSVSSGIIGFHGTIEFGVGDKHVAEALKNMLKDTEEIFKLAGYRIASDIEPKEKK